MKIEENLGVVKSFELPDNWEKEIVEEPDDPDEPPPGGRTTNIFHPAGDRQVLFCHHHRSQQLSRLAAEKFQAILYAPFHDLTEKEIEDLSEVIEGLANKDVFSISQAGTGYLNDRRIIRIKGDWLTTQQSTMSCFADSSGNGRLVQNLYFSAPLGQLEQVTNLAESIFLSIRWSDGN